MTTIEHLDRRIFILLLSCKNTYCVVYKEYYADGNFMKRLTNVLASVVSTQLLLFAKNFQQLAFIESVPFQETIFAYTQQRKIIVHHAFQREEKVRLQEHKQQKGGPISAPKLPVASLTSRSRDSRASIWIKISFVSDTITGGGNRACDRTERRAWQRQALAFSWVWVLMPRALQVAHCATCEKEFN